MPIPYTNICTIMGHVLGEQGHDKAALVYKNIVTEIREAQLDPFHSEVANALSNSALSMVGCGRDLDQALAMLQRSLDIDLRNPYEDHKKVIHLRHYNLAFTFRALGRLEDAKMHIDVASACARAEFGENSRYLTMSEARAVLLSFSSSSS